MEDFRYKMLHFHQKRGPYTLNWVALKTVYFEFRGLEDQIKTGLLDFEIERPYTLICKGW